MVRRVGYGCLLWLVCTVSHAQTARLDGLVRAFTQATDGRDKCDILHQLTAETWDYNFERALEYAKDAHNFARRISYGRGITLALTDIGTYYYFTGNYKLAMSYYRRALSASPDNLTQPPYLAETYTRIANLHRIYANFDSCEVYFRKAEGCLEERAVTSAHGVLYHNRGLVRYEQSRFDEARHYFRQALQVRLSLGDSMACGESWKTIGVTHTAMHSFDSAMFYFNKIRGLALRHNNPELLMFYNLHQGEVFFGQGDFLQAMRLFNVALDSLNHHPFRRYQAIVLKNIGRIFETQGDYQNALDFFYRSLKIDESAEHRQEVARTYILMGWVHAEQRDAAKAYMRAGGARKIFRAIGDQAGLAQFYTLRGYITRHDGHLTEALHDYDSALAILARVNLPVLEGTVYDHKAQILLEQGDYVGAIRCETQVYTLADKYNDHAGLTWYYNTMARIMVAQQEYGQAEHFALLALEQLKTVSSADLMREVYSNLSAIYRGSGRYEKAMQFYEAYIHISDSLYTGAVATRQAELNALYQLEKNEQEIGILNQQNNMQQSLLAAQKSRLRFQNTVLILAVLACILMAVVVVIFFRYNRTKSKANEELSRLNSEISEQKEEIQAQSEELSGANRALVRLNMELTEKTEEIQAQSEELRETNEMIVEINRDLDLSVTKRTAQLKEAYKELDTFFYRSSHDFRRPLTTFMGLAEVAKITVKDKTALELFEKVKETARSLDKMLVKLQSISDVGAQELIYKEVLVEELFHTVCKGFRDELDQRDVLTTCVVSLPEAFVSYPAMIRIILENLVENSIQFSTPYKPHITLRAYQVGTDCVMEVEDNGQGIQKDLGDRIFDMYFRGSERSKGNGLGLYIVKKAVEKLKGSIRVDTNVVAGAKFILTFPLHDDRWPIMPRSGA
jgi:signal transduction histidine kinase/Tfp pilus assembly protein PilF